MSNLSDTPEPGRRRMIATVLIGLAGSILIWVVSPYALVIIEGPNICDSYLPVAALFLGLVLVLGVNPFLRWAAPRWVLDKRQMAVILGMFLVACVLPGQGLLRMLPYGLATTPVRVRQDKRLAEVHRQANLPPSLFPDKLGYEADTPASDHLITELPEGQSVPWSAWAKPALTWGLFLAACWLMMMGLSLIVLPQWRHRERLAFPLLTVQEAMIEEPEEGFFAPMFRKRSFWIAATVVLVLHLLAGANTYWPQRVPAVPLSYDVSQLFTGDPLRYLPGWIFQGRIYFIFLAIAFFMPTRASFSIWFFALAYAVYTMVSKAYFPPFRGHAINDHRNGAILAVAVGVIWLGRKHWAHVLSCLVRRPTDEVDRRDRKAAAMFLLGCAGMFAFMLWVGVEPWWALVYVVIAFATAIVITRIVVETGMPFIRLYTGQFGRMIPFTLLGPASAYFSSIIGVIFVYGSRASVSAMGIHALGLDRRRSPRRQSRLALGMVGFLVVGLIVCGGAHLWYGYHHSSSIDGRVQPVSYGGAHQVAKADATMQWAVERKSWGAIHNRPAHMAFGAGLAGLLQWLCMVLPKFPLHPIGLVMANTYYSSQAWISILIGCLAKLGVLRYGGARAFRAARPFFLGLIMGEVFATVFWAIEPAVRVLLDLPYQVVPVHP